MWTLISTIHSLFFEFKGEKGFHKMTLDILNNEPTVGQLVAQRPGRARIFEKHGIDYCCGGGKTLSQVCRELGLDAHHILFELDQRDPQPSADERDWTQASLTELADHIEQVHHQYLKEELPRIEVLSRKVVSVHGNGHPELLEIHKQFTALKEELESHILREERVLFPLCRRLDRQHPDRFHGALEQPISVMVKEHEDAGEALAQLRRLSHNYTPPPDACNSFRRLYEALSRLESDLHQHVHKENNILFPRAIEAVARLGWA